MSYNIENLSFTIFGNGHDYTLLDSGDGGTQVFSHPFVPLNSTHYAGQWFFVVPDENGEPIDPIKDDIAHCTFTPAIGSTFDTEGEIEVKCHYHREYVYPEETIVVDKEVKQTIEVVDHGAIINSAHHNNTWNYDVRCDVYADGYAFFRPYTINEVGSYAYASDTNNVITKCSSIPWRASSLGYIGNAMLKGASVTDIEELQYADTSKVSRLILLSYTSVSDLNPLAGWDVSNVTNPSACFWHNTNIKTLEPLKDWITSKFSDMSLFISETGITTFKGMEDWDFSNVLNMSGFASNCPDLVDISGALKWKTEKVTNLSTALSGDSKLTSLHGLENWVVNAVTNFTRFLHNTTKLLGLSELIGWTPKPSTMTHFCTNSSIGSLHGLENFDVSECTDFSSAFQGNWYLKDCSAVSGWNTSNGTNFSYMLNGSWWLDSLDSFASWVFKGNCNNMFGIASVLTVDNLDFDLRQVTNYGSMFYTLQKYYSSKLNKDIIYTNYYWYDEERHQYSIGEAEDLDHPLSEYTHDATDAENWLVTGTNLQAFNAIWSNRPSWN